MSKAKSVNLKGHREASVHVFLKYHRTFCTGNILRLDPDMHEPSIVSPHVSLPHANTDARIQANPF